MSLWRTTLTAGAALAALATASALPATSAMAQASKPNIMFIMGDDIGYMQPSIYPEGLMWRDAQHPSHRPRRDEVHRLLRHAELHLRAHRVRDRHVSASRRADPAATPRQPDRRCFRTPALAVVPARPRLHDRRVRQEPSGRQELLPADRARFPGILGLSLPPRRDGGRELPRHLLQPGPYGRSAVVPPCANTPVKGWPRSRRS